MMMVERRRRGDKGLFLAYGLIVAMFVIGLKVNHDTAQNADSKIRAAAVERVQQINAGRRDVLVRSCREQNRRHDNTIRKLDGLIADLPPGRRRERAKAGRASTVALIEALAPKRQCVKRADRLLG